MQGRWDGAPLARPDARGGEFKTVRNCAYSTNSAFMNNSPFFVQY